jgi:hypothetical protein
MRNKNNPCVRTCAGGDWRRGDAADPGERESAVVVDGDAVGACGAGEEVAEADRVGADQAGQLGAARLFGEPRGAPLLHEREAVRHVEQRVHARRVHPAAARRARGRRRLRRRGRRYQQHRRRAYKDRSQHRGRPKPLRRRHGWVCRD